MNELRIFNNADFGDIRTVEQDGGIWFVGKDVAEALGYSNPSNAVISHVDDEDKLRTQIKYAGQNREVSIINESGLYSLVLSSKLPSAKAFKRWITSEVIPSIRKTGSYNKPSKQPTTQQEQRAKAMLLNAQSSQCKLWLRLAETMIINISASKKQWRYWLALLYCLCRRQKRKHFLLRRLEKFWALRRTRWGCWLTNLR